MAFLNLLLVIWILFASVSKYKWKKIVKQKLTMKEFNLIQTEREMMSKGRKLPPPTMKIRKYLEDMKPNEALVMLKIRTGMLNVRANYRNHHETVTCPMCETDVETTNHMMTCKAYASDPVPEQELELIWSGGETPEQIAAMAGIATTAIKRTCERELKCIVN